MIVRLTQKSPNRFVKNVDQRKHCTDI